MPPEERASLVAELFDTAIEQDTTRRQAFLNQRCGSDPTLRAEVESLVRAAKRAPGFLESGPIAAEPVRGAFAPGTVIGD